MHREDNDFSVQHLRELVQQWSDRWGIAAYWAQGLNEDHGKALTDSGEGSHALASELMEHASHGRRLICRLAGIMQRPLPTREQDIRELFFLMDPLYRGVSCLEARISIISMAASNALYPSSLYTSYASSS